MKNYQKGAASVILAGMMFLNTACTQVYAEDEKDVNPKFKKEDTVSDRVYTVRVGDTLSGICKRQYNDASLSTKLAIYNGILDENKIYMGQSLLLPQLITLLNVPTSSINETKDEVYVVKKGDTLYKILEDRGLISIVLIGN